MAICSAPPLQGTTLSQVSSLQLMQGVCSSTKLVPVLELCPTAARRTLSRRTGTVQASTPTSRSIQEEDLFVSPVKAGEAEQKHLENPLDTLRKKLTAELGEQEEKALERAARGVVSIALWEIIIRLAQRVAIRGAGVARRALAGEAFSVILPFLGALFVLQLARDDWKRKEEEKEMGNLPAHLAFVMAFAGDSTDFLAHTLVGFSVLKEKYQVGVGMSLDESSYLEYVGLVMSTVATVASVAGEVLTRKDRIQEADRVQR